MAFSEFAPLEEVMDGMTARDPLFADKVRDSFSRQNAMGFIGARLTRIEPAYCEIELPYREELTQQHGFFHGGLETLICLHNKADR